MAYVRMAENAVEAGRQKSDTQGPGDLHLTYRPTE